MPSVHTPTLIPRELVAEDGVPEGRSFFFFKKKKVIRDHWIVKATPTSLSLLRCCVTMTIIILRGDHFSHEQVSGHAVDADQAGGSQDGGTT